MVGSPRAFTVTLAATLTLAAASASAVTVSVGDNYTPITAINPANHPELAGTTIFSRDTNYSGQIRDAATDHGDMITVAGVFHTSVVREAAAGTLDYYYTFTPSTYQAPAYVTIEGIDNNISIDAYALTSGPDSDNGGIATRLSFYGGPATYTGPANSLFRTNLTTFSPGNGTANPLWPLYFTDGAPPLFAEVPAASPTGPIPEPASLTLLPLALTALALRLRR